MANGKPQSEYSIEIDGLFRWFGETCAVSDLSFAVKPGEVIGFIGPNGAGKTTTMRILSTLDEPDLGDAYVDGFSVTNDPDRVRFRLGFMPDTYGAYANVSCVEYLDFFARSYGLIGPERIAAVRRVLDFTHMHHMADKPTTGLSKGMKQRLCLGRTLIHDPQVLILDEPAAGLDPRARIELKEMISNLAAEGKSLLISSHILSELAEMCDRVVIIEHGQLLAVGTVDDILQKFTGEEHATATENLETVIIKTQGDPTAVVEFLQTRGIENARVADGSVLLGIANDLDGQKQLLAALIQAGLPIYSFSLKQRSLEEAFMKVTRGRVQ